MVHTDEGFDFLSFHIRRMRKRGTTKRFVYTKPSTKAIASVKDKVKTKTHRSTLHMGLDELLTGLNQAMRGWANYYRHAVSKKTFNSVDYYAWQRVAAWIHRKHGRMR